MDSQIDGDIEHFGAFREIHAQEKDIAPAAVREIHADRGAFAQNRVSAIARVTPEQFRPDPQGVIGRVPHAEHPLVAAHRANAAADLVGQGLKCQPVIRGGQGARDGVSRPLRLLHGQEAIDRFFKSALQQVFVTAERDERTCALLGGSGGGLQLGRQVETVDGVKEEQGPDPLVKVFTVPAEGVQPVALLKQYLQRQPATCAFERLVAQRWVRGGDDRDEIRHSIEIRLSAAHATGGESG